MLTGCRVLDLTTERGLMCGQMLGDLGADVIKVEPPGGSSVRALKPFFADEPGPERSVYWWAYNRNKRGITLDLESSEGRELFKKLVASTDILIESENPGHLASYGLGYSDLNAMLAAQAAISISNAPVLTGPGIVDASNIDATLAGAGAGYR